MEAIFCSIPEALSASIAVLDLLDRPHPSTRYRAGFVTNKCCLEIPTRRIRREDQ